MLSDVVGREKGVWRYVDERDGVVNECDKSSTTSVTRSVLPDSGVVWEGIWRKDFCRFEFGFLYASYEYIM